MSPGLFAVIIEAPGKAGSVTEGLAGAGLSRAQVRVVATWGHLRTLPRSLSLPTLDPNFREIGRAPRETGREIAIREAVQDVDGVLLLTDFDQEGDVIALDAALALIRPPDAAAGVYGAPFAGPILRAAATGFQADVLDRSLAEAHLVGNHGRLLPEFVALAGAGRSRAALDRLIGAAYHVPDASPMQPVVGRVATALLGAFEQHHPDAGTIVLQRRAGDSGAPVIARLPVWRTPTQAEWRALDRWQETLGAASGLEEERRPAGRPHDMGSLLLEGAQNGVGIADGYQALQDEYMAGRFSYPRSSDTGLSERTIALAGRLARQHGLSDFDVDRLAARSQRHPDRPHDAPHPLVDIDPFFDLQAQAPAQRLGLLAQRRILQAGMNETVEVGFSEVPQTLSDLIRVEDIRWERAVGPAAGWRRPGVTSNMVFERTSLDARALALCRLSAIGRPSTWVHHVGNLLDRGLVDDQQGMTPRGLAWLDGSPESLLDGNLSRALEHRLDRDWAAAWRALKNRSGGSPSLDYASAKLMIEDRLARVIGASITDFPEDVRQPIGTVLAAWNDRTLAPTRPTLNIDEAVIPSEGNAWEDEPDWLPEPDLPDDDDIPEVIERRTPRHPGLRL